jgi:stage V sporulation protein AD
LEFIFAGDLLNQCIGSAFSLRDTGVPFFGLYGACSRMAESLSLCAITIDGGYADCAAAITSSHFCSAERQFRFPLEYGGQRTPPAQWTVTGSGAIILPSDGPGPYIKHVTSENRHQASGRHNMGAAMAPAAYSTLPRTLILALKPATMT